MFGLFGTKDSFEQAQNKSRHVFQYKCRGCRNTWWGNASTNTCRKCSRVTLPLPLQEMVGIGWFQCACSRRYAGFSRGDVTSKCHGCNTENLPLFIVPGTEAAREGGGAKKSHYCSVCEGHGTCPIVESAMRKGGRGGRKYH